MKIQPFFVFLIKRIQVPQVQGTADIFRGFMVSLYVKGKENGLCGFASAMDVRTPCFARLRGAESTQPRVPRPRLRYACKGLGRGRLFEAHVSTKIAIKYDNIVPYGGIFYAMNELR